MFLSCLELDYRSPSVRQCIKNCQDMHRTIMKAMPNYECSNAREQDSVLYRIISKQNKTFIYVLCKDKPDWQRISGQGFKFEQPKDVSGLNKVFVPGACFTFDLVACTAKKQSVPEGNSKRVFLKNDEERINWLNRKAEQNGFKVGWVREEGTIKEFGVHTDDRGSEMWHMGVRFRGELIITDKDAFLKAFTGGIGPGKAYGFGMLMLFKANLPN